MNIWWYLGIVWFYQKNNEKYLLLKILKKDRIIKGVCEQIKVKTLFFANA